MSKHTPGPWHIGAGGATVLGPDDEMVARLPSTAATLAQRASNARLIATAPDLLVACESQQRIIGALEGLLATYRLGRLQPPESALDALEDKDAVKAYAAKAIAKAEGW